MVAPLVAVAVAAAVAGCSSGSTHPDASASASTTTSPAGTAASTSAAARLAHRAIAVTERLHSYAFAATTTVAAGHASRSLLTGRVVAGEGIAYRLVTGGRRTEVVRTRHATYVRKLPGRWSRLAHPRPVVDPTADLVAILRDLASGRLTTDAAGHRQIHQVITAGQARAAKLPTDGGGVNVMAVFDGADRVTLLDITTSARAGAHNATITVRTSYSRFGHAAGIRPPA